MSRSLINKIWDFAYGFSVFVTPNFTDHISDIDNRDADENITTPHGMTTSLWQRQADIVRVYVKIMTKTVIKMALEDVEPPVPRLKYLGEVMF